MRARLALIYTLVAVLGHGWAFTPVYAQFGLSAGPELLPWLKPGRSGSTRAQNPYQDGTTYSELQKTPSPPINTGWLAPFGPGPADVSDHTVPPELIAPGPHLVGDSGLSSPLQPPPSNSPNPSFPTERNLSDYERLLELPPAGSPTSGLSERCDPHTDSTSCWQWFIEPAGLVMGRNDPNRVWFSYQSNNNANELMNSQDARTSWQGGWEMTVRRTFACDNWRLEASYWGLAKMTGQASAVHPDYVSSTLIFTDVVYADPTIPGLPEDLFFGAYEQRLWRTNEIHNVEVNLVRHRIPCDGDRLGIDWLVGVRYFHFDERLTYGSRTHEGLWGQNPELEGYLSDRIKNDLIGVQLGFDMHYPLSQCLEIVCTPKIGLYNNHLHNRFDAYRGDGAIFAPNPDPPVGDPVPGKYPVISSDDRFAVLSQLDARIQWHLTPRWQVYLGYRLISVSEIGLADTQFPPYVVDIVDAIAHIDSNGDLLLHGAFAGTSVAF